MSKSVILCGVGGQGTVLASKLISYAAMAKGEEVRSAETIGMAQRGGSVTSHVRIGEGAFSPLIPKGKADVMIAFEPAEAVRNLSYLKKDEQKMLMDAIEYTQCTPSHAQAIRLRAFSIDGALGPHVIENIMNEEKPNQKDHISVRYEAVRKYIPSNVPYNKTGDYIMKALAFYQRYNEKKKADREDR